MHPYLHLYFGFLYFHIKLTNTNFMNENVKIIRELKNFTQKFMASQLMISQSNYSRMEKGSVNITIDKLEKISSIFEISVSDIINFDETVVKNILKKKKLKDVIS